MKYKEFQSWCNDRAADGCWDYKGTVYCIELLSILNSFPFWKREKIWKTEYEAEVVSKIIQPIHEKMIEYGVIKE
jgi:hypothetical protein